MWIVINSLLSIFICTISYFFVDAARIVDEIKDLPGWSPKPLPSRQYSGFVNASEDGNFVMHYWFIEAENDKPSESPLLLWFNGGPGASSLYGLLVELGPFLLSDLSYESEIYKQTNIPQLIYNPYGWQKVANLLVLSMPPPVGFSYCNPPGPVASGNDCGVWNDTSTASVTYYAIKTWINDYFPEYKSNDLFVAGESYAGVYVPMIVQNFLSNPDDGLNLKGFAVGDACTPPDICGSKQTGPFFQIQFLYGKSAFSNKLYEEIMRTCTQNELLYGDLSEACSHLIDLINTEVGGYWVYGYYDNCWYENDIRRRLDSSHSRKVINIDDFTKNKKPRYFGPPVVSSKNYDKYQEMKQEYIQQIDPVSESTSNLIGGNGYSCGGPAAQVDWLNRPEVRKALHIPNDAIFFQCDNGADFTYEFTSTDLVSWYKDTIAGNKLRILVYNGDTDPCINSFQAQNWTRNLNIPEVQSWRPWTVDGCQSMGGYVTRYQNNFDFLTIKGSGHMVPLDRPQVSLEFISKFLTNHDYLPYVASCAKPAE
eukprot:gene4140-5894_t